MPHPALSQPSFVPPARQIAAWRSRKGRGLLWPTLLASALLFLPSAMRYVLGTSSNTAGLLVACAMFWTVAVAQGAITKGSFARRSIGPLLVLLALLTAHLGIAVYLPYIVQNVSLGRTAGSLGAVFASLLTAGMIADWLRRAPSGEIDGVARILRVLLVFIGIWCFVGLQPPSAQLLSRPSFPFTEPSHFALVATPFVIDGCVKASLPGRLAWLATWLTIGLLNQSLSLIVAVAIAAGVTLPVPYMVAAGVAIIGSMAQLDIRYYTDRLDFSTYSTNLSSLVYRQGWELMQQGLAYSNGWGVGFQQLGFAPLNAPTSDLIYRLLSDDSNLRDGSFLAAKLVSELGVFGLVLVIVSMVVAARTAVMLRAMAKLPTAAQSSALRFAAAVTSGFVVEMLVRGIGYFSSTVILFAAAVMVLSARPSVTQTLARSG